MKKALMDPIERAEQLLEILRADLPTLQKLDRYWRGEHDLPYHPETANEEFKKLASECVSNWMGLLVQTPVQAMFVDDFRRGEHDTPKEEAVTDVFSQDRTADGVASGEEATAGAETFEWQHWQRSLCDARQSTWYSSALAYGHSFVVTEKDEKHGKSVTRGLSSLRTAAVYDDPANDIAPLAALHVKRRLTRFTAKGGEKLEEPGVMLLWDEEYKYTIHETGRGLEVAYQEPHGASECPVTRFAASVDLDGRTTGVIQPMIPLQDRINQTVFDLLVAQSYSSFKVRWITGMAPPTERVKVMLKDDQGNDVIDALTGEPVVDGFVDKLDSNGNPIPIDLNVRANRIMFAEDKDVKMGSFDETPLGGYIESIDMSIRHLAAISQTPPHYLLGQIANISAEALQSAEISLSRKIELLRKSFGECIERFFRVAREIDGAPVSEDDFSGEVKWRDMEGKSLSSVGDALLKLKMVGVPEKALWTMIPGRTSQELQHWAILHEEEKIISLEEQKQQMQIAADMSAEGEDMKPMKGDNASNQAREKPEA